MRVHLHLHLQGDGSVTAIAYDLYNDQGELVSTWVGSPKVANSLPHAGLSDLLRNLDSFNPQMSLFP